MNVHIDKVDLDDSKKDLKTSESNKTNVKRQEKSSSTTPLKRPQATPKKKISNSSQQSQEHTDQDPKGTHFPSM